MSAEPTGRQALLQVENLSMRFERARGFLRRARSIVRAVDDVSFTLHHGETLALVGESGCGKTTLGRCIARAIEPSSGRVIFRGKDLLQMSPAELKRARQRIRLVFQDPFSSLNPRMSLLQIVGEPLLINRRVKDRAELREKVAELLRQAHLDPAYMNRYPHAFSGGQRQRIAIARALALEPEIVIADEPVSALDVSVQAQILNLLKELQSMRDLSYLFIAHNLAVVRYQSDRVAVMYLGKIVEISTRDEIFDNPRHPYTALLLASSPNPDPRARKADIDILGEVPDPAQRPGGCSFHPRCPFARQICREITPELREATTSSAPHRVACHLEEELDLSAFLAEASIQPLPPNPPPHCNGEGG